jgi:glycosyltransferase involved in cell wall biosynthesis
MVTVTVALATYNGAKFLAEQLDSIQAQTVPDLEIVVSDDGSEDGTWELLEQRAAREPRMRIMRNPSTRGVRGNFESAIAAARGAWIAPADQDDIWEADKLAVLLDAVRQAPGAVMAYSDSELIDSDGRRLGKRAFQRMVAFDGGEPLILAFRNCVSGHAMLFHRGLLEVALPFPDAPIYDWWLATAATSVGRVVRVDRPLVRHRQHGGNVTDMAGLKKTSSKHWSINDQNVSARWAAFSRLPGSVGDAYRRLHTLWERRREQFFALPLAWFGWRHRKRLWSVRPKTTAHDLLRCAQFAIGRRWLTRPTPAVERNRDVAVRD